MPPPDPHLPFRCRISCDVQRCAQRAAGGRWSFSTARRAGPVVRRHGANGTATSRTALAHIKQIVSSSTSASRRAHRDRHGSHRGLEGVPLGEQSMEPHKGPGAAGGTATEGGSAELPPGGHTREVLRRTSPSSTWSLTLLPAGCLHFRLATVCLAGQPPLLCLKKGRRSCQKTAMRRTNRGRQRSLDTVERAMSSQCG